MVIVFHENKAFFVTEQLVSVVKKKQLRVENSLTLFVFILNVVGAENSWKQINAVLEISGRLFPWM